MSMMGKMYYFLRLQIKQLKDGIFINQSKYYKELLKRLDMDDFKAMSTPMGSRTYVDQDESGVSINITKYQVMIGSLLYLTASRPDIMFSVCLCARFQANPKEPHLIIIKRITKYLKGITNVRLWYPKGSKTDRKSTSGTCHILGNALISWACKKQACVALSTDEA
ncbi:uncharacterized mitochondrial protein AtMg00810-like [Lathyrus oleraceus]|uniref:uncharacterized mitochondrial protein AtMg00810-like n=1 Tax=Pisum sativum TaxID=3888 RepID=UPI0021D02F5B|nr:uncharacterized mitochondrial protein AtMg00810-like [Pisum sativum]